MLLEDRFHLLDPLFANAMAMQGQDYMTIRSCNTGDLNIRVMRTEHIMEETTREQPCGLSARWLPRTRHFPPNHCSPGRVTAPGQQLASSADLGSSL